MTAVCVRQRRTYCREDLTGWSIGREVSFAGMDEGSPGPECMGRVWQSLGWPLMR
jgi:hypothetical protein